MPPGATGNQARLLARAWSAGRNAQDLYQVGVGPTGVLKKSARCDRAARELAGRSPSTAAAGGRPASASATSAAGGPAVAAGVAVIMTPSPLSRSKMPPP